MKTIFLFTLSAIFLSSHAQQPGLVQRAKDFLNSLNPDLRSEIMYRYEDSERFNWNFVPMKRRGVSLSQLTKEQRTTGFLLLKESLSNQGYQKANDIIALEGILRMVEGRDQNDRYRDPEKYFFTFFGEPSGDKLWGWRFEGHHLALNFSSSDGAIAASAPSFFGANPAVVPSGERKGYQTLKKETELGFVLVNSFTVEQLKKARFSEIALPEIVTGNSRSAGEPEPRGIFYNELTNDQKKIFNELLAVYIKNYQFGFARTLMEKIEKAGIEKLSFGWAGGMKAGEGHYYRIQGPVLLIEYDNTQANANHVHTVVRDLTNDFAAEIMKEHYLRDH